jgi:hypothetical protein
MVYHNNFENRFCICDTPNWFELRSRLYAEVSKWVPRKTDELFFKFHKPNCGWMDFDVYVNGAKMHSAHFSSVLDPFYWLKIWMEDVANDFKMCSTLPIDIEGRTLIFHYENIKLCDVSFRRKFVNDDRQKDEWEGTDANTHPTMGLFCIYDSNCDTLPVVCLCTAKQLLFSLYNGLLTYTLSYEFDAKAWDMTDKWELYNNIKSPLIEWFIYSDKGYRHEFPKFKQQPKINETIHMWAEWGGGLFWQGRCCGNAERFCIENGRTQITLEDIPEIREWYNEFDNSTPEDKWPEEEYNRWFTKGWELAKLVKKKLPDNVDLFYQWKTMVYSSKNIQCEIPLIVPNENMKLSRRH